MLTIYDENDAFVRYDKGLFPGGEIRFVYKSPLKSGGVRICATLRSSDDILELLLATDAYRQEHPMAPVHLTMPYCPYARQDRVSNPGEPLSIKVFTDLINRQLYDSVEVWDAHSDVTTSLLDRCKNYQSLEFIKNIPLDEYTCLVAPDAGAVKKIWNISHELKTSYISASKHRDTVSGNITGISLNISDKMKDYYSHMNFLIVDDICDGGKTFVELSRMLRCITSHKIALYVTHGIFSQGFEELQKNIDHVYTANMWPIEASRNILGPAGYVTVLNKEKI